MENNKKENEGVKENRYIVRAISRYTYKILDTRPDKPLDEEIGYTTGVGNAKLLEYALNLFEDLKTSKKSIRELKEIMNKYRLTPRS